MSGLFSKKGSNKALKREAQKAAKQAMQHAVYPYLSTVMGNPPGVGDLRQVVSLASFMQSLLSAQFTEVFEGQNRINVNFVTSALGSLCGFECAMTVRHYLPELRNQAIPVDIVEGANGSKYLYGDWINWVIEPVLQGLVSAAGLSNQYDYSNIIKRTAERVGGDEYWHVVFPSGELVTDAPKSFVEMLGRMDQFETVYAITMVSPRFRSVLRPSFYLAAFVSLLEEMKTASPDISSNTQVFVNLFIECFYPCAHYYWE